MLYNSRLSPHRSNRNAPLVADDDRGERILTRLVVGGNRFFGCLAPVVWPTASESLVVQNTLVLPEKWIGRILQENRDP